MRYNMGFVSHELGDSRGIMSRDELPNGNVYWEFVDDEFFEMRPLDWMWVWLSITRADGTEFTVDNFAIFIY